MGQDPEFQLVRQPGQRAWLRNDLADLPLTAFWAEGSPLPRAKGRALAQVLELRPGLAAVVRDFRRGGAFSFLFSQSYLDPRRPRRELLVLARLRQEGVPVVEPLAALARRRFLVFYHLRLITRLVEGARPLPAFIAECPHLRRQVVGEAGRVFGLALAAGLLHRDLHPDNLIARELDGSIEVWILDLDRARLQPELGARERDRMLIRMARYLRRHAEELPVRSGVLDSLRFLAGMGLDRQQRRSCMGELVPAYRRELARHGLLEAQARQGQKAPAF